jgi:hypothetical protein
MRSAVGYIRGVAPVRSRFETGRSLFELLMTATRNLAINQSDDRPTVRILSVLQPDCDPSGQVIRAISGMVCQSPVVVDIRLIAPVADEVDSCLCAIADGY